MTPTRSFVRREPVRQVRRGRTGPGRAGRSRPRCWQATDAVEAGTDKGVIVLVLALLRLRWGELAGLHVADVDMLRRRIHFRRNAVNVGGGCRGRRPRDARTSHGDTPAVPGRAAAAACRGKGRDGIVFSGWGGGYAKPPGVATWF